MLNKFYYRSLTFSLIAEFVDTSSRTEVRKMHGPACRRCCASVKIQWWCLQEGRGLSADICAGNSVSCLYRPPIAPPLKGESRITDENSPEPQGPLSDCPQPSLRQTPITVHILREGPERFCKTPSPPVGRSSGGGGQKVEMPVCKMDPTVRSGGFLARWGELHADELIFSLVSDFFFFLRVLFQRCHAVAELRLLLNGEETEGSEENPLWLEITSALLLGTPCHLSWC